MKTIGHRIEPPLEFSASARKLIEGARFNDELKKLPTGNQRFFPKGLYRYRTHEESTRHWEHYLVAAIRGSIR